MNNERFFMRVTVNKDGQNYYLECEAERSFSINGFRFFAHDGQITDALTGSRAAASIGYIEDIERARAHIEKHFYDKYLPQVKKFMREKRVNWGYKQPFKICAFCRGKRGLMKWANDIHGDISPDWEDCGHCGGEGIVPIESSTKANA